MKKLILLITLSLFVSCCKDDEAVRLLSEIKTLGNSDPTAALVRYDSCHALMTSSTKHIRERYALLGLRLRDKADITATNDSVIKRLIPYFVAEGTNEEIQEAYYYAGSVYRDLNDIPRAIDYFLKANDRLDMGQVDSIVLRNGYSQLHSLYMRVQDYKNALAAANMECKIAQDLGILDDLSLVHIANAAIRQEEYIQAGEIIRTILNHQDSISPEQRDANILYDVLYSCTILQDKELLSQCCSLLPSEPIYHRSYHALAVYHQSIGHPDSCIHYNTLALEKGDLESKYDASKALFFSYLESGDSQRALSFAKTFIDVSTELDLGTRQEMAATINNQYQCFQNKEEELKLKTANEKYRLYLYLLFLALAVITITFITLYLYKRYQLLKSILSINEALELTKEDLMSKKQELENQQKLIYKNTDQITAQNIKLENLEKENSQLQQELRGKIEQNRCLLRMQHMFELKNNAEDILDALHRYAEGGIPKESINWDEFLAAMDLMYPLFHQQLSDKYSLLKKEQIHVCYLLKAGFTGTQIENMINGYSHATIWRWIRKYKSVINEDTP